MATPISTEQESKSVIVPGDIDTSTPWVRYYERFTWDLDPTTLVPIGVRVEKTIA